MEARDVAKMSTLKASLRNLIEGLQFLPWHSPCGIWCVVRILSSFLHKPRTACPSITLPPSRSIQALKSSLAMSIITSSTAVSPHHSNTASSLYPCTSSGLSIASNSSTASTGFHARRPDLLPNKISFLGASHSSFCINFALTSPPLSTHRCHRRCHVRGR